MIRPRWTMGYQINKTDNKCSTGCSGNTYQPQSASNMLGSVLFSNSCLALKLSFSVCWRDQRRTMLHEFAATSPLCASLFFHLQPSRNRQCHWDPFPLSASALFMKRSTPHDEEHINPIWSLAAKHIKTSKHNKSIQQLKWQEHPIKERMWKNGIERHHSITPNPKGSFKRKKEIRNHPIARQTQGLVIKNSVELQPLDQ